MLRFLRIVLGFIAAMLAAGATQVMFAMPPAEFVALDEALRGNRLIEMSALMLRAATHSAIFCAGFAPIAIVIGELLRLRGWAYYTLAGIIMSLGGFIAEYASENAAQPTIVNTYALIAFVVTGAVGGFVYWIVAGHHAGRRRSAAHIRVAGQKDRGNEEPGEVGREIDSDASHSRKVPTGHSGVQRDDSHDQGDSASTTDAGDEDNALTTRPMTSAPKTGPKVAVRPGLAIAGSVPDSGMRSTARTDNGVKR